MHVIYVVVLVLQQIVCTQNGRAHKGYCNSRNSFKRTAVKETFKIDSTLILFENFISSIWFSFSDKYFFSELLFIKRITKSLIKV